MDELTVHLTVLNFINVDFQTKYYINATSWASLISAVCMSFPSAPTASAE